MVHKPLTIATWEIDIVLCLEPRISMSVRSSSNVITLTNSIFVTEVSPWCRTTACLLVADCGFATWPKSCLNYNSP